MRMRAQWVVDRRQASRLARDIADAGGTLRARSEVELEPRDLDEFGDGDETLFSVLDFSIGRISLLDLITQAIEAQDACQVLVADLTGPCLRLRQLPAPGADQVVIRVGERSRRFDAARAPLASRLLRSLLRRAVPKRPFGPGPVSGALRYPATTAEAA